MKTPANKAARQFNRKLGPIKPDLELLQNETIKENVMKTIAEYLQTTTIPSGLNETHDYIIESLKRKK